MTSFANLVNLGQTVVASDPGTSSTQITLPAGTVAALGLAAPLRCTAYDPAGPQTKTNTEVMYCTSISGDTLTVLRAQENTTAQQILAGWVFDTPATAGTYQEMQDAITAEVARAQAAEAAFGEGAVASVAGRTGAVTLTTSDIAGLGSAAEQASSAFDAAGAAAAAAAASLPASQKGAASGVPSSAGALAISGTPSAGEVLTAASATTANWQAGGSGLALPTEDLAGSSDDVEVQTVLGGAVPATSKSTGYLSLRNDFSLNPSMSVSSLTTAIQDAFDSAISAGQGLDLGADLWPIDQPLTIAGNIALRAAGAQEVWSTVANSNKTTMPGASPWVQGGGITQQANGANILEITGTGACVHLRDMLLTFSGSGAFTNTGHGIYAVPSATVGSPLDPDNGLTGARWDNVIVFGHDGSHYGYYLVNCNLSTFSHTRSHGGGGWYSKTNSSESSYGNYTNTQGYYSMFVGGTADCIHIEGVANNFPGSFALATFIRPQALINDGVGTVLGIAFGLSENPVSGTNYPYRDNDDMQYVLLVAPDLEPFGWPSYIGKGTTVIGPELSSRNLSYNTSYGAGAFPGTPPSVNGVTAFGANALGVCAGSSSTAVGYNALAANTTGTDHVAVGQGALAAMVSNSSATAVGLNALAAATAGDSTAVGFIAAAQTTSGVVTAVGYAAAYNNVTGTNITAIGTSAGQGTGSGNTSVGAGALGTDGAGGNNTAVGYNALNLCAAGTLNTAVGVDALSGVAAGGNNIGFGYNAGGNIVSGSNNTILGWLAGNTDGTTATTDVTSATLLGELAQATTNNVIVLGKAVATRPNMIFGGVGAAAAFGGGVGVFAIANAVSAPKSSNPVGGGYFYVTAGALHWVGSSGTDTAIAVA